jgi:hypothetical protein
MSSLADIFISYAHADKAWAAALAEELERNGWSVWWDRDIPTGREFRDVIEEALAAAKCVIVLWSAAAVDSEFVRSEASRAQKRGVIMPVLIDETPIPIGFDERQAVSILEFDPGSPGFRRLLEDVGTMLKDEPVKLSRYPTRFWLNTALLAALGVAAAVWLQWRLRSQVGGVVFVAAAIGAAALFAFAAFEVLTRRHSRRLTWALAAVLPVLALAYVLTPRPVQLVRVVPGRNMFFTRASDGLELVVVRNGRVVVEKEYTKPETIYLGAETSATLAEIARHNGDDEHKRQLRDYLTQYDKNLPDAKVRAMTDRWIRQRTYWPVELRPGDALAVKVRAKDGQLLFERVLQREPGDVVPTLFLERPVNL